MRTYLYSVKLSRPVLGEDGRPSGEWITRPLCTVHARETDTFFAYHLLDGKHLAPNEEEIVAALPHYLRRAFARGQWWFPKTLLAPTTGLPDDRNAATHSLLGARGRFLGKVLATPYLFSRGEAQG